MSARRYRQCSTVLLPASRRHASGTAAARRSRPSIWVAEVDARRRLFVRAPLAAQRNLRGRRVVVTGAAPGPIGFETAATLASWGAEEIGRASCRERVCQYV